VSLHITKIHGNNYVLGLLWQSVTPGKDNKKEARKIGETLNKDLLIIRSGENLQAGYCSRSDGVKEGTFSLAAAISKGATEIGITGTWLGVFKLPDDSYAFIATNEGMFLPDGDFGGNADEVRDKLTKAFSLGLQWTHIILPPEFIPIVGAGITKPLEEFLPTVKGKTKTHKWWALEPVKPSLPIAKMASVLLLASVSVGGFYFYNQYEMKKEAEEQARKIEIARKMFANQQLQSNEHLAHPWATQITSVEFVDQCLSAIRNDYISPAGWTLNRVSCNPNSIEYSWDRNSSTINHLLAAIPTAVVDQSADKANLISPLTMTGTNKDEQTVSALAARSNFLSYFQAKGLSVKITEEAPPPPPAAGSNEPVPVRDWKTFNFEIQSPYSPNNFKDVLSYSVTRVTRVDLSLTSGKDAKQQWTISGLLYSTQ